MILIDSSAWIEFLRDTDSAVCNRVDKLIATAIATCDPIVMGVLAGARDESHLGQLRALLARASKIKTEPAHYEQAAALYRTCRRAGETVRSLIDCLISAHAIQGNCRILHADADFDVLARHTALRLDQA